MVVRGVCVCVCVIFLSPAEAAAAASASATWRYGASTRDGLLNRINVQHVTSGITYGLAAM